MVLNILKQFNWVDIFFVLIFIRICYIAASKGFSVELFKLCGTILAIYLSLHYYVNLSDFLYKRLPGEFIPLEFFDFLIFILITLFGYSIFLILRETFFKFIKIETVTLLNKWGGLIIGIARSCLLIGIITYALVISSVSYLKSSAEESYLGQYTFRIIPEVYRYLWDNFASKFMTQEKTNTTIVEIERGFKTHK